MTTSRPADTSSGSEHPRETIDVEALMADLRQRVAEKKAAGLYTVDALAVDTASSEEPIGAPDLDRLRELAVQQLDLSIVASDKPVVGGIVTKVKRTLVRGTSQPLIHASAQTNQFNAALLHYVAMLGREVAALNHQLEALRRQITEDALTDEVRRLNTRLDEVAGIAGSLQRAAIADRLNRLEHLAVASEAQAVTGAPAPAGHSEAAVARLIAEAEDDDDRARERWTAYAAVLGRGPILLLGAGSGKALEMLGPDSEGVESDADLVAVAHRCERRVHHADPLTHLASLPDGAIRAVLVTRLMERMDATDVARLAHQLARCVAPAGRVIIEGINPSALATLGNEFWRDAARIRPLHPDTIRSQLDAAGFSSTTVELLHPPPVALDLQGVSADPSVEAIRRAVVELNATVHGPSRFAVHAVR